MVTFLDSLGAAIRRWHEASPAPITSASWQLPTAASRAVLLLSCFLFCQNSLSGEDEKATFLAEYEPSAKQLEAFYSNMTIRGVLTRFRSADEQAKQVEHFTFLANDRRFRLDRVEPGTGSVYAIVVTPRGAARFKKNTQLDVFSIDGLNPDYNYELDSLHMRAVLPNAPYSWGNVRVIDLLPNVVIKRVHRLEKDERPLVRIDWQSARPKPDPRKVSVGSLTFSPRDSWALLEFTHGTLADPDSWRRRMDYEPNEKGGIPKIKSVTEWTWSKSARSAVKSMFVEATEIIPGPAREEEFTFAAFGLPDMESREHRMFYILLAALGLLILALFFRYLAKRRVAASV